MRPVFVPTLLHEPTGDPGLWVDVHDENRALLFDLGDLGALPARKIIRVERVYVTHTHIDHFIGFDRLLRLTLARDRELTITGPAGFLGCVQGKIDAYTWNLIRDYPVRIVAEEVLGGTVRSVRYTGAGQMRAESLPDRPFHGTLHAERLFTVHGVGLDHGIPVLGLAVRETERISVNRDRVDRLGLAPGPWLRELKQAVRRCRPAHTPIMATSLEGTERSYRLDDIAAEVLLRGPGQRIAYLTDFAFTPENIDRATALARNADLLVCECTFLHADRRLARDRGHLTAREAGEIARVAGVKRLVPFHFSPRYKGREHAIVREAADAFGGPTRTTPWLAAPPSGSIHEPEVDE